MAWKRFWRRMAVLYYGAGSCLLLFTVYGATRTDRQPILIGTILVLLVGVLLIAMGVRAAFLSARIPTAIEDAAF